MGKRATPEEIIAKLREAEVRISRGETVAQASRAIGVTEQTFYRWRKEYGGLQTNQARRMKDMEKENQRLRKAISDSCWTTRSYRKSSRESTEPFTQARCCRSRGGRVGRFTAPGLPRDRPAPLDSPQASYRASRRSVSDGGDHLPGRTLRALRLSADHGPVACRWMAG